jgi:hypothetical protein
MSRPADALGRLVHRLVAFHAHAIEVVDPRSTFALRDGAEEGERVLVALVGRGAEAVGEHHCPRCVQDCVVSDGEGPAVVHAEDVPGRCQILRGAIERRADVRWSAVLPIDSPLLKKLIDRRRVLPAPSASDL